MKRELNWTLSGNEVSYTNSWMLLVKNMLRSKLGCQKGLYSFYIIFTTIRWSHLRQLKSTTKVAHVAQIIQSSPRYISRASHISIRLTKCRCFGFNPPHCSYRPGTNSAWIQSRQKFELSARESAYNEIFHTIREMSRIWKIMVSNIVYPGNSRTFNLKT